VSAAFQSADLVLAGTYADIKTVKTRSVVQVVIELPIERIGDIVAMFGAPIPGAERWVAIAPLAFNPYERKAIEAPPEAAASVSPEGRKLVQSAVLRCREPSFQMWVLRGVFMEGEHKLNEERTAEEVKRRLGVKSRNEIGESPEAARKWRAMLGQYEEEQRFGPGDRMFGG
jgi:hypothetical protein